MLLKTHSVAVLAFLVMRKPFSVLAAPKSSSFLLSSYLALVSCKVENRIQGTGEEKLENEFTENISSHFALSAWLRDGRRH